MRTFKSCASWLLLTLLLGVYLAAQETGKAPIPERVTQSLNGLQKTRTANGVFNIRYLDSYFWALERSVYVNVSFRAELDDDAAAMKELIQKRHDEWIAAEARKVEAANKKVRKEEDKIKFAPPPPAFPVHFHDLYMRVLKDGQVIQEYRSHIPFDGQATEYFSFGTVLDPGDYDVLLAINRADSTLDGTQVFPLKVPALRVSDLIAPAGNLAISTPVFHARVSQMLQQETRFTVVKNKYQIGPAMQDFFPWGDKPFRSSDKPILTFFVLGAKAVQGAEPWNISAVLEIRRDKESVARFAATKLTNPYFFQPFEFIRKDKDKTSPLAAGEYVLGIELVDNNQGGQAKGVFAIPFRISE
ncbi:MAG: hypothetical protein MUC72_06070 [Acidobacteria bacterium]|jgi:hypothetical protein|nr:hypothetical protein [Acidobacteriota bacterium]